MEEIRSEFKEVKRPWQGNLWIFLNFLRIFYIAFSFFGVVGVLVVLLILVLLNFFRSLFLDFNSGDPGSILFSWISYLVGTLIFNFINGTKDNFYIKLAVGLDVLFLVYFAFTNFYFSAVSIFMIYLSLSCLDKKFYNQKNSIIRLV